MVQHPFQQLWGGLARAPVRRGRAAGGGPVGLWALPGNRRLVTFGSSSNGPMGSTMKAGLVVVSPRLLAGATALPSRRGQRHEHERQGVGGDGRGHLLVTIRCARRPQRVPHVAAVLAGARGHPPACGCRTGCRARRHGAARSGSPTSPSRPAVDGLGSPGESPPQRTQETLSARVTPPARGSGVLPACQGELSPAVHSKSALAG